MFLWSRLCSAAQAGAWEERLQGHHGAVVTQVPGRKTIRVEIYCPLKAEALGLRRQYGGTVRPLRARNWAALVPQTPPPVKVRDSLIISAESEAKKLAALVKAYPQRAVISIPADMAFGTGHHETTATVLRLLADIARTRCNTGWSFCDLGTGTGVLAIAAAKLGAAPVTGCDFDPHAVRVAQQNVRRNRVPGVSIAEADVMRWKPAGRYDCVAANLFSEVLIAAFPGIVRLMKPGGIVLLSGILRHQASACLLAGRKAGLTFDHVVTRGKWVTAQGRVAISKKNFR